jgi:hypothetical protein
VQIVVVSATDSRALWKGRWAGHERVFRTHAGLTIDGDILRLTSTDPSHLRVDMVPAFGPPREKHGVFSRFTPARPAVVAPRVAFAPTRPSGALRTIKLGGAAKPVAEQPSDADFAEAAEWKISLPPDLDLALDPILRFSYEGDVARVTLNGRLLVDDFYHGREIEIALRHYTPEILRGDLRIAILPLQRDAVVGEKRMIYLPDEWLPDFGEASAVARIEGVELVPRYTVEIDGRKLP